MKKLTLSTLIAISTLTLNSNATADDSVLAYPFSADSGKYWQYVSDRVMGGISDGQVTLEQDGDCLLYTSPSPRDGLLSRMPSSA